MNITQLIKKSNTKTNKEVLINSNQQHISNTVFSEASEIQIIVVLYLIFKMFRKIKMSFDINLRISGRNKKFKQ